LIQRAQGYRSEATSDFQKSLSLGFPDAAFWVWITEMESGQHDIAHKDLSVALNKPNLFKHDDWPSQIGNFLLGTSAQDQLMAKARTDNETETNMRLCQAWFYSGMNKQFSGDTQGARACFAQAMATESKGSEEFVEANRATAQLQKP
jgi:lipoprotein NlpI